MSHKEERPLTAFELAFQKAELKDANFSDKWLPNNKKDKKSDDRDSRKR